MALATGIAWGGVVADLSNEIETSAQGPKRASGDSGSVERYSLQEQIEADRYLAAKSASKRADLGIRIMKTTPPGARDMS